MAEGQAVKSLRSQWAAQFLCTAELTRRSHTVAFTMGNRTPDADLMVCSPGGRQFLVDVKGLSSRSDWLVKPKAERDNLFYVLVWLAPVSDLHTPDRFFVLTQKETNTLEEAYRLNRPGNKHTMPGFRFNDASPYEDKWGKLLEF